VEVSDRCVDALMPAVQRGDRIALEKLLGLTYERLRLIACNVAGPQAEHQTLGPSALINEGFLKICGGVDWSEIRSPAHFYSLFASCMKQALIDHVRRRKAEKRGGNWTRTEMDILLAATRVPASHFLEVTDALEQLRGAIPRAADVLEWKLFGGLTTDEIALLQNTSRSTVESDYRLAKAFLRCLLK